MYTFPQFYHELKLQLGQQLAHAQTFDRSFSLALPPRFLIRIHQSVSHCNSRFSERESVVKI